MKKVLELRQNWTTVKVALPAEFNDRDIIQANVIEESEWEDIQPTPLSVTKDYWLNALSPYYFHYDAFGNLSPRKIEAIKYHRQHTASGLKESKDFVEAAFRELAKRQ